MSSLAQKWVGWLVGVLAAVALIAGLTAVMAEPAHAATCPNDGVNTMGQQPSDAACFSACFAVHGLELIMHQWNPTTGCCRCFY